MQPQWINREVYDYNGDYYTTLHFKLTDELANEVVVDGVNCKWNEESKCYVAVKLN